MADPKADYLADRWVVPLVGDSAEPWVALLGGQMAVATAVCLVVCSVERKAFLKAADWAVRTVESMVASKAARMVALLAERTVELSAG